jgi:hypothetical protein
MGSRLTLLQAIQYRVAMERCRRRGSCRSETIDEALPREGTEDGGGTSRKDKGQENQDCLRRYHGWSVERLSLVFEGEGADYQ